MQNIYEWLFGLSNAPIKNLSGTEFHNISESVLWKKKKKKGNKRRKGKGKKKVRNHRKRYGSKEISETCGIKEMI